MEHQKKRREQLGLFPSFNNAKVMLAGGGEEFKIYGENLEVVNSNNIQLRHDYQKLGLQRGCP